MSSLVSTTTPHQLNNPSSPQNSSSSTSPTPSSPQVRHVHSRSLADPISLTLKPPPAPTKGHRHRRSAAISGDFDSPTSFLQNLQASALASPSQPSSVGYDKFINDFSLQTRRNSTNTNSGPLNFNLNFSSMSVPTSPVKTENTVSQTEPVINLDDIINLSSPLQSVSISAPSPSPATAISTSIPKFQILQSPKTEIVILEEEQLESTSLNNVNSFSLDYASNNSSNNSLNQSSNPLSNLNTASINSLKGKVRYQSYYNMAAPSTPKNYHTSSFVPITPSTPSTPKHTSNRFNHQRLSHSISMSPVKSSIKSPFQYKSKSYEISEDESPITTHSHIHSHTQSTNSSSTSTSTISFISSNQSKDNINQTSKSQIDIQSLSTATKNNTSLNKSVTATHNRSSSLFSLISKKLTPSNHNRKSSLISTSSTTKDETSLMINDSTLNANDITLTSDNLGEPGPMIDILSTKDSSLSPYHSTSNIPKRNNYQNKQLSNSTNTNNSTTTSKSKSNNSKHRFMNWLSKSKKQKNIAS